MPIVPLEEGRKQVPVESPGGIFVYRPHTDFSEFIMRVVDAVKERGLQRAVILVQKGVETSVIEDATERIAELLESEKLNEQKKIALECFHGLTRSELRRIKRDWERS